MAASTPANSAAVGGDSATALAELEVLAAGRAALAELEVLAGLRDHEHAGEFGGGGRRRSQSHAGRQPRGACTCRCPSRSGGGCPDARDEQHRELRLARVGSAGACTRGRRVTPTAQVGVESHASDGEFTTLSGKRIAKTTAKEAAVLNALRADPHRFDPAWLAAAQRNLGVVRRDRRHEHRDLAGDADPLGQPSLDGTAS